MGTDQEGSDLGLLVDAPPGTTCVEGLNKEAFLEDRRTQQTVVMSLIIIGEASTKITDQYPDFAASQPQIPWRSMRGVRNRIAHGYFDINLEVVWGTIRNALPDL